MLKAYPILKYCPLFKGMEIDEINELMKDVHYQVKSYAAGQMVLLAGERADRLLIVLKGSVKGEMADFSGKTIKIEDIEAPKPLAIAFLFGKDNVFPVDIIANESTALLVIPKESLLMLFHKKEAILIHFLNSISDRSQFLSKKIKLLSFQTIKGKIANYLLQLNRNNSNEVCLDKSQNELAELFGVARPSVGRAVRELHNEGVISAVGKKIKLLDVYALQNYLK